MKQWKGSHLRHQTNWNSVPLWWFFGYQGGSKPGVKGNLRWVSWIVTLAPPSLWAQTNDFISCVVLSPNFYSCSFISRGTCHLRPQAFCIVNQEQIQEGERHRETSPRIGTLSFYVDFVLGFITGVSCVRPFLTHSDIFFQPLENWSLHETFHEGSSVLLIRSSKITGIYL